MDDDSESVELPGDFAGVVRLFPLPDVVLFPHVVQPLHIFELRYREMLADAMASDRLIAMALLSPGWEAAYDGRPNIYPVVCLGRVTAFERLDDGRSNILLRGLRRATVIRELPPDRNYRLAEVAIADDVSAPEDVTGKFKRLRENLVRLFGRLVAHSSAVREHLKNLEGVQKPSLGTLADVLAYILPLPAGQKQQLLAEYNVERRLALLMEQVKSLEGQLPDAGQSGFPPGFSDN